jgi:hypothetical protein
MSVTMTQLQRPHNILRLKDTAPESFYSVVGILIVFWLIATRSVFKALATYRAIKGTPTSLIRSAAQGNVELNGTQDSALTIPLNSPLTFSSCTWYDYVIEKKVTDVQNNVTWETIYRNTSITPLLLHDKTGECWIFPEKAQVSTSNIFMRYETNGIPWSRSYPANKPLPPLLNFLWNAVNILTLGTLSAYLKNRPYRHIERIMKPNDPLYAMGFFRSYHDSEQNTFKDLLNQNNTKNATINWIPSAQISGTKHALSMSTEDKKTAFLLSSNSENKLIREQLGTLLIWLGISIASFTGIALFMAVY